MNRFIHTSCVIFMLANLTGCKHESPAYTIGLLDVSKSITAEGIYDEFKEMDDLADRMHRGDQLAIVPITGNTQSEAAGRILSLTVPLHREPYDNDLVVFRRKAHTQIAALCTYTLAHPSGRTDILGALSLAKEKFDDPDDYPQKGASRTLVIFSDFVEDDGVYRFAIDPALVSDDRARALAEHLKQENGFALHDVRILLRALPSTDQRNLTPQRKKTIRTFWADYLSMY